MRKVIKASLDPQRNPQSLQTIRCRALELTQHIGSKNFLGEVGALQRFCFRDVKYRKDIRGVETLQTPLFTLRCMQGDCDDKTILFCALAESIGHETRVFAVGMREGEFSHVLAEVKIRLPGMRSQTWIPVELTEDFQPGYFPDVPSQMRVR